MDQGSAAEIMYPDLFKGLNLRAEDLMPYSSPLISFEGKIIISKGQVRLPVQTGSETVEVDFIDRKSTRLNSSHLRRSRMPSSA